jgi:Protein of unknown function (DUF2865)
VAAAVAAMAAALASLVQPALAESMWQRALGLFGARTPQYRNEYREPYPYSRPSYGYGDDGWQEDTRTYRTMCVRLCDGFYFPLSNSVRRGRLYHDNRACMQRCDGEARLFYYPTDGGSVETMVDLAGRSYQSLPNAFRYRKALVAGCACKPAPWSPEEAARHQGYAAEAAQATADGEIDDDDLRPARTAVGPSLEQPYYFEPPQQYVRPPAPSPYTRWRRPAWAHPRYGWRD